MVAQDARRGDEAVASPIIARLDEMRPVGESSGGVRESAGGPIPETRRLNAPRRNEL